jgi:hypothetical protein
MLLFSRSERDLLGETTPAWRSVSLVWGHEHHQPGARQHDAGGGLLDYSLYSRFGIDPI